MLKKSGRGSGEDVLVIDKTSIAAGASGIACGVVRNNYFQPAMRELMAHSVSVWESDPEAYSYHPVGYMQTLVHRMAAAGQQAPESNTAKQFIYRIGKLGHKPQQLLLVCRAEGIRIYGLAPSTFQHLERFIDSRSDPDSGRFTGQLSTDQISYIGKWKI